MKRLVAYICALLLVTAPLLTAIFIPLTNSDEQCSIIEPYYYEPELEKR
jgi:hypothetical protein